MPGYVNLDQKYGDDVFPVRHDSYGFAAGSVDEIRCSHVLEHFPYRDGPKVIKHWVELLKPGGALKIAVPDLDKIVKAIGDGNPDNWPMQGYLFGGQVDGTDFHQAGYNEAWLTKLMTDMGLTDIHPWVSEIEDCASLPVSLNLQGTKPLSRKIPAAPRKIPKTVACMSLPRHAFTANMFAGLELAFSRQIAFEKVEGAFWHQCLERVMSPHVDKGDCEWILTLDYDTYFTVEQFDEIARLMIENPHADAIAPMQVKRDDDKIIMGLVQEDGQPMPEGKQVTLDHFNRPLVRASWAHFGMTIIRVEALKRMTHPWFVESPNKDGRWEEHRVDADIGFWKNFALAGNKLYLAAQVAIGHCQQVVTLPDKNLRPQHAYITDLQKFGYPEWVRR